MTPTPRFLDKQTNTPYEIVLLCRACGWAIIKDQKTQAYTTCHRCGGELDTFRNNYPNQEETT